jgi:methyl-accepting chemotaxis protein
VDALVDALRSRDAEDGLVFAAGASHGFAVQRLPDTGLRVVSITPLGDGVTGRITEALWQFLGLGAGLLALGGAAAWLTADALARRLRALTAAVRRVGGGQLDTAIPGAGTDEIGRLAATLSSAMARLRDAYDNLEQKIGDRTRQLAARNEELRRATEALGPGAGQGERSTTASEVEGSGR